MIAKAHPKDPRTVRPVTQANDSAADIAQLAAVKTVLRNGVLSPANSVLDMILYTNPSASMLRNLPLQLTFTPFSITDFSDARLLAGNYLTLIPQNLARYALILTRLGTGNQPLYSFGPPIALGAGQMAGITLRDIQFETHVYTDQTCPIDDVNFFLNTGAGANRYIYAFEGTISTEGNAL